MKREIIGIFIFNISEAARIIYLLVKNPSEGKKKKKIFDQDVGLLETCLESVPSVFIITVILVSRNDGENLRIFAIKLILFATGGDRSLYNIIFDPHSSLLTRIFGFSPSQGLAYIEFFTTYFISIISAALGLAKCLKNGVARPIAPGGTLDGLFSGKFCLTFLSCSGSLVARGLCIGFSLLV